MKVEKICRICLETKKNIKSIYENVGHKYLPSIIEDISGVIISTSQEPFGKICSSCTKAILQAELIISKCRENNKLLQQQQRKHAQHRDTSEVDEKESHTFGDNAVKEDSASLHSDIRGAEFDNDASDNIIRNSRKSVLSIEKEAKTYKDLKKSLQEDYVQNSVDIVCDQQNSQSPNSTRILRKRKAPIFEAVECSSGPRKYVRTVNVNKDYFFKCDICEFSSYFATYFREHMVVQHHVSHPRIFKCQQCDCTFLEYRYLQQHIAHQHEQQPRRKKFLCSECGKDFIKSNHLRYHQRSHLPKHQRPTAPPVKCKHCNKDFSKLSIGMHIKTVHSLERPFACVLCRSSFALAKGLQAHMKVCHPAEVFVCPCCEVKFRVRSVYETHVQRGTCQKLDFNCDYCAWGFKTEKRLEKHKLQVHKQMIQQRSGTDGNYDR